MLKSLLIMYFNMALIFSKVAMVINSVSNLRDLRASVATLRYIPAFCMKKQMPLNGMFQDNFTLCTRHEYNKLIFLTKDPNFSSSKPKQ